MSHEKYLTVYALNRYLKAKLDSDVHLNRLLIQGELSNVKIHTNGHCYFTLKDEKSRIQAVMFASALKKLKFTLEDGMKVLITAKLSVYEPYGMYQLNVEKLDIDGLGNLFMAYEKLKEKLEKNGLFDAAHKKTLPLYAQKIGLITAPTGAAIHDMIRTIHLKCPCAKINFYPSLVQGNQAADNLIEMLQIADQDNLDVIVIGRGGGSLEDLWAFNNEALAYAIYEAKTPIISGVGHESDVTICDFVADYRAATPTAAASQAVFSQADLQAQLIDFQQRLAFSMDRTLKKKQMELNRLAQVKVFQKPHIMVEQALFKLDYFSERLVANGMSKLSFYQHQLELEKNNLYQLIEGKYARAEEQIQRPKERMIQILKYRLDLEKKHFSSLISELNALSPLNVLERGYTLVLQNKKVQTRKQNIDMSKELYIRFADGDLKVVARSDLNEEDELQ